MTKPSPMIQLAIRKFSKDAIPAGGGLADGVAAIKGLANGDGKMQSAMNWAKAAVDAVRNAAEPNPYKEWTDDQIAELIVSQIDERRKQD